MTHSLKAPGFVNHLNISSDFLMFSKCVFFKCKLCRYAAYDTEIVIKGADVDPTVKLCTLESS